MRTVSCYQNRISHGWTRMHTDKTVLLSVCIRVHPWLIHPQGFFEEREDVRGLVDQLGRRLAGAVACLDVDADQDRGAAFLRVLQGGGVFEAVAGNAADVVVGGGV